MNHQAVVTVGRGEIIDQKQTEIPGNRKRPIPTAHFSTRLVYPARDWSHQRDQGRHPLKFTQISDIGADVKERNPRPPHVAVLS
jgi:hypothetical protein